MKQKRIAAIHDISGLGKCSLTVALPICSAAGLETAVIPTAVLSTHTGGFKDYTFCDLTDQILPIAKHWKQNGFLFDAFYTGYLGSEQQADLVVEAINMLKSEKTVVICDPAMADNGNLYAGFSDTFPSAMLKVCCAADIILPNITEACLLLGKEFCQGPYTKEYIEDIIYSLYEKCNAKVVLTGVYFDDDNLGAACYDGEKINYIFNKKINRFFHGTGDVFASCFTAAFLNGKSLNAAVEVAVNFTCDCINATAEDEDKREYGVCFEKQIPTLLKYLEI